MFDDMTGPNEVNRSRAEGLHADNGCRVETATEVVSETALVEDASPVPHERDSAMVETEQFHEVGPRTCFLM
jgi:hypothetical protein